MLSAHRSSTYGSVCHQEACNLLLAAPVIAVAKTASCTVLKDSLPVTPFHSVWERKLQGVSSQR